MSNIVENNNNFTNYLQIWSKYIFVDEVPEIPPELTEAASTTTFKNADESEYTVRIFQKSDHELDYNYLIHLSNFQLTKEFRQGKSWLFNYDENEESIRQIILPNMTASRKYQITFSDGSYEIPYTSIDPKFNFEDCRLEVGLDFDKLYFTGWLYIGKSLQDVLKISLPPFSDTTQLLKNSETGNLVSFHVNQATRYELPSDTFTDTEDSHTIITTNILNQALNSFGDLDEGEYW